MDLGPDLRVRQIRVKGGWSFRFTGSAASPMFVEPIFDDIEARFGI